MFEFRKQTFLLVCIQLMDSPLLQSHKPHLCNEKSNTFYTFLRHNFLSCHILSKERNIKLYIHVRVYIYVVFSSRNVICLIFLAGIFLIKMWKEHSSCAPLAQSKFSFFKLPIVGTLVIIFNLLNFKLYKCHK